jgi:MFS family permease
MTSFAAMLQVYQISHSSIAVGSLGIVAAIPVLSVGLIGGSFADSVDRRKLVLVTSSALALVSAALAIQAFLSLDELWLIYILIAVQAVLESIGDPARRTFLPRLLSGEQIPAGVALNQVAFQASVTLGPALAGVLTAWAGLKICYLIDALTFAAALYGVARLPAMLPEGSSQRPGLRAVADGLRFIKQRPILAAAFLADLDAMVLGMPRSLFPALNALHFGGSAQTLGLLNAAPAVGGLLALALSGPVGRVARQGRAMLICVAVWGGSITLFGISRELWLSLLLLGISGIADNYSVVFRSSIVQRITPDRFRGRIIAVDFAVGAGGPQLGNFEAGAVGSLASPVISAVSGGIATIIGALVIAVAIPSFAAFDSRAPRPDAAEDDKDYSATPVEG